METENPLLNAADKESRGEEWTFDEIRPDEYFAHLPVHQLAKRGDVEIRIIKRDPKTKQVDLSWHLDPQSPKPRALSYKIESIYLQEKLDQAKASRPFPRIMRIGTIADVARALGLAEDDTITIKEALHKSAAAYFRFKLPDPANPGKHFSGGNTRFGIAFKGDTLPDGNTAETIYILWNEPFYSILNHSKGHPLDQAYRKQLPPAAHRFYDIVSFKMYAAIKNFYATAKLRYSEFCEQAPLTRYYLRQPAQNQMNKIHRPHIRAGYMTEPIRYEQTTDGQGRFDMVMHYTPGPRAIAEYINFNPYDARVAKAYPEIAKTILRPGDSPARPQQAPHTTPRQRHLNLKPTPDDQPAVDDESLALLQSRGIGKDKAKELLRSQPAELPLLDQIEWGDAQAQELALTGRLRNAAGLYIWILQQHVRPPETFETSRKRQLRQEAAAANQKTIAERAQLRLAYEQYQADEIKNYIATVLGEERHQALLDAKIRELSKSPRNKLFPPKTLLDMAKGLVCCDLERRITFTTLDAFAEEYRIKQSSAGTPADSEPNSAERPFTV